MSMPPAVRNLALPVIAAVVVLIFWNTFLVYPLKIFVVFLHELSHGIAAVMTGGDIVKIELSPQQGGVCFTSGGIRFFILSAGYLGSLFWGALLLMLSAYTKADRGIVGFLGALTLIVTLLYVRSLFGFAYGITASAAMLLVALKLSGSVSEVLVKVLGVTSCLYAVWDIASDVLFRSVPSSDASQLASITFIPAVIWGILWVTIALVVTFVALKVTATAKSRKQAPLTV